MDFEKKLSEMFNQPSFQKKSQLKDSLVDFEFFASKFNFVRTRWFYKKFLKYKLLLNHFTYEILWAFTKKTAALSMAVVLFVSFVASPLLSSNSALAANYKISALSGSVFVERGSQILEVLDDMELFESDTIRVSNGSIAQLNISSNTLVRLGQNSILELGNFAETAFLDTANLRLESGSAWVNSDFTSLKPVKIELETPHFDFDLYKSSQVAIKVNSTSLLSYNYKKPVTYFYQGKRFMLNKMSKAVLNSNKQSDLFVDNLTAFMNVNKQLDQTLLVNPVSENRQIAGILPGESMYPLDLFDSWLNSVVTIDSNKKIKKDITELSEQIAEVDLLASSNTSLIKVKKKITEVTTAVKANSKISENSSKKEFLDQLTAVEKSLDKNTAPEVYFELKTMISKAKLDVSDESEKSSIAIDSANQMLSDLSVVDPAVKQKVLPKLIDELNFVLSSIQTDSNMQTANSLMSRDVQSMLEDTLFVSQTLESDIVADKNLSEKVKEFKKNLDHLVSDAELDVDILETTDTFIEFDAAVENQVQTGDFSNDDLNETSLVEVESDTLELDFVELPEDLDSVVDMNSDSLQESLPEVVEVNLEPEIVSVPDVEIITDDDNQNDEIEIKNSEVLDSELEEVEVLDVEFR